jgi:membrane dipeptidase
MKRALLSLASAIFADPTLRLLVRDRSLVAEAAELGREAITVDLHCHANALAARDFPAADPALAANMKTGGVDAGLFAIRGDLGTIRTDETGKRYEHRTPKPGELFGRGREQLELLVKLTESGQLALARSPQDVLAAKKAGLPAAVLAIEGADPLEGDLAKVKYFYDRGVRVVQLLHYRINELGDIQTDAPRHNGLTQFGRAVVRELNRLGVVVDTAHASSETVDTVLAESRVPVLFSHTAPRVVRPQSRRLADDDIKAIAKKGGVIGIWPALGSRDSFETFLRRLDYMKQLVGADHFGVATDQFGLRGPTAIPTHKDFSLVAAGLLKRGYSESDTAKIVGGSFMRLFKEVSGGSQP